MVEKLCNHCGRPVGMVPWYADLVLCRRCEKAEDVYTPPRLRLR